MLLVAHSQRAVRNLRVLVGAVVVGSGVHYADNVFRFDRYIDPDDRFQPTSWINAAVVAGSWFAFAAAMIWGLWSFERGRRSHAAIGLAIGSSSGLVTLAHFVEVSPNEMDWFQLAGISIDFIGGVAMLAVAVWIAYWAPDEGTAGAEPSSPSSPSIAPTKTGPSAT